MSKLFSMTTVMCGLLTAGLLIVAYARQAEARPTYMGWWSETYPEVVKKNKLATSKEKCNVCHGATKKVRNAYGKAIQKALDGKKNLKKTDENKELFEAALKKVATQNSGTPDKTFGDLLDSGELPAKK